MFEIIKIAIANNIDREYKIVECRNCADLLLKNAV